jgi:hypothetical protein
VQLGINDIAGKATLTMMVLLLMLLLCFCGGLLMRIKKLKQLNKKLEDFASSFIPDYKKLKSSQTNQNT